MANLSYDRAMMEAVDEYLNKFTMSHPQSISLPRDTSILKDMLDGLLEACNMTIEIESALRTKEEKWSKLKSLRPEMIATVILRTQHIRLIQFTDEDISMGRRLAIYQCSGPNEGIYSTDTDEIERLVMEYSPSISQKDLDAVVKRLRLYSPLVQRCRDRDLIAVNNGIFNFRTKTLQPFDPELVFTVKSRINYTPNAINQIIYNPNDNTNWDVESWMNDLSDDPEIVNLLWEILGAIIRPNVRWNKSAWFYSTTGNNGKGTLCELMRQLCGAGAYASIPIADFAKKFALEPLITACAIIVDENNVGEFVDKAGNLKAVITNDVIAVEGKYEKPVKLQFFGFMVQCINEMPRIKDRSDSFYRRQLFVPFDKCFTGRERKYIKDDYLHRAEVLEYVLHKVLHMDYYTLSEPKACKDALEEYKEYNDPVRQFVNEILPQCVWDLLPFTFLYDLYKAWFRRTSPSGTVQGRNKFIGELLSVIDPNVWSCPNKEARIRPGHRMDWAEPLIMEYDLKDWMSPLYCQAGTEVEARPVMKASYSGLQRVNTRNAAYYAIFDDAKQAC